jgi:hypothetical protein
MTKGHIAAQSPEFHRTHAKSHSYIYYGFHRYCCADLFDGYYIFIELYFWIWILFLEKIDIVTDLMKKTTDIVMYENK